MTREARLQGAREAFRQRAWASARSGFADADEDSALSLDDIERYAAAAHLIGEEAEAREVLTRGYRESLARSDVTKAARFAIWLWQSLFFAGESAQAGGWIGRARTILSERGADCVEWGFLLIPAGVEQLEAGNLGEARATFTEARSIARRFADADLLAVAGHGLGRTLIRLGLPGEGMGVLDEAMVAVTSDEVSPFSVGNLYCGVLEACGEVYDLRRAREWTAAFSRWCESQPDLVPYRGPCLVHRVELMRLRGDWEDALGEAKRACDWLSLPTSPEGPADAFYQLGELYRLRGDFPQAEEAYRQASRLGRPPEPGLALLWLACDRADAAENAIRRALDEAAGDHAKRAELLAAHVQVLLAQGSAQAARGAATELASLAQEVDAVPLSALADGAEGNVLIAEGKARAALGPLRRAWAVWKELDAPYEAARVRVLIAAACRALGDQASAAMEIDAARWVLEQLGAAPDLARLDAGSPSRGSPEVHGLTPREIEVLSLIAAGETNKVIAAALVISEHTVARHVQNMLQKLGFSSRASLAAFAVREGLTLRPPG